MKALTALLLFSVTRLVVEGGRGALEDRHKDTAAEEEEAEEEEEEAEEEEEEEEEEELERRKRGRELTLGSLLSAVSERRGTGWVSNRISHPPFSSPEVRRFGALGLPLPFS